MPSVDPDFYSAIRDLFDGQDYTKEPAESEESPIQLRVRRTVKVGLINALRSDPTMKGRILGILLMVISQIEFFVKFKAKRNNKVLKAIVWQEAGDEILVNLDTLFQLTIIPKCFPLPMDSRLQGKGSYC